MLYGDDFFKACDECDITKLQTLLYPVNNRNATAREIFLTACANGFVVLVKYFLEHNDKLNGQYKLCLSAACSSDIERADIVKLLCEYDVIDQQEKNQGLRCASQKGHVEVVKILIEHGADPTDSWYGKNAINNAKTDEIKELLLQWKYRVDGKEYCKLKALLI